MSASGSKSLPSIGFLTVKEFADLGLIGGYLVLNASGRPLEFHCTAPVRPNRPQEILYGPTLRPFLYGEQIGKTLICKAASKPLFVCTDVPPALHASEHVDVPLVLIERPSTEEDRLFLRVDQAHQSPPTGLQRVRLGSFAAQVAGPEREAARVTQRWQEHATELDLAEPFSRLSEALTEAQKGATR